MRRWRLSWIWRRLGGRIVGEGVSERGSIGSSLASGDSEVVVASVWRRLIASLVDWIVAVVSGIIGAALVQVEYALSGFRPFAENLVNGVTVWSIPGFLLVVLATHLAFGFVISWKGGTLGHRLLGLWIVRADGKRIGGWRSLAMQFSGSPLIFGYVMPMFVLFIAMIHIVQRANEYMPLTWISEPVNLVIRHWLVWGLVVCLLLMVINHVWMSRDALGQGLHDRLVGTFVVRDLEDVD